MTRGRRSRPRASLLPGGMEGCPTAPPDIRWARDALPSRRRELVRPPLPGRADAAAVGGLAPHRRGERRPGGLAHRFGQDPHGFPGRHRCRLPRRRGRIGPTGHARGPLYLAAAGAGGRRAREPPRPPDRDPGGGRPPRLPRPGPAHRHPHRGHAGGRARRHEEAVARPARHDAGVAVPAVDRTVVTGAPARRAHRHRRRGAHAGPRQAGQPPGAVPGAVGRAGGRERRSPPAHRPLRYPAAARPGGAAALRRARRPAADRDRRLRARPRPRCGHRAALDRAGGRHERRPDVGHPRPHRRAHARPPHDPDLRQHAEDGRTGGPSTGRAAG